MTLSVLLPLLAGWALAVISPGPATMAILGAALGQGRATALAVTAGVCTGSLFWGSMAALGMGAAMASHAWALEVLRYAGAAYLLWLAIGAARRAASADAASVKGGRTLTLRRAWAKGAAIHLTNPKAVFFWGSVFAVALPTGAGRGDILTLLAACAGVSVTMLTAYALIFSTPRAMAFYARARRWFDAGFAALFGAAGIGILLARV